MGIAVNFFQFRILFKQNYTIHKWKMTSTWLLIVTDYQASTSRRADMRMATNKHGSPTSDVPMPPCSSHAPVPYHNSDEWRLDDCTDLAASPVRDLFNLCRNHMAFVKCECKFWRSMILVPPQKWKYSSFFIIDWIPASSSEYSFSLNFFRNILLL